MTQELGIYLPGQLIDFTWDTFDSNGASITRSTNGTIRVYKGNSVTERTAGITDTEDFDGVTGVHHCRIDTSDAFYVEDEDYTVQLNGATIDGQPVNATIARFSLGKRLPTGVIIGAAVGTPTVTVIDTNLTETQNGLFIGGRLIPLEGPAKGERTVIEGFDGTTKELTVEAMSVAMVAGNRFMIV